MCKIATKQPEPSAGFNIVTYTAHDSPEIEAEALITASGVSERTSLLHSPSPVADSKTEQANLQNDFLLRNQRTSTDGV